MKENSLAENNALILKLNQSEINQAMADDLKDTFMPFFEQAEEWTNKAKAIVVIGADQKEEIELARTARINLKDIRIAVEKTRKTKKEESLRQGKAIDGMANVIKFLIVPIEEHLLEQENFVKIQEQKVKAELKDKRELELAEYEVFDTSFYNLADMPEENYLALVENSNVAFRLKKDAERKQEEKRIADEKAAQEEREKFRKENEKLKKEAAEKERLAEIERKKQEKILAEQREKAEKEAAEREKLEAKIQKDKEDAAIAEANRIEKENAEIERLEEIKRQSELAPDKKKLEQLAVTITQIQLPELKDEKAKVIIKKVVKILNDASNLIKQECLNL